MTGIQHGDAAFRIARIGARPFGKIERVRQSIRPANGYGFPARRCSCKPKVTGVSAFVAISNSAQKENGQEANDLVGDHEPFVPPEIL